ncbi:MAG: NfeD family protein [Pseudobacteriovorax sp.]|nr:NfeD family protein [Pseudobacteriovorax sp.]
MNFWLYLAIILILAEFLVPGAVLIFIGLAAGIVGVLVYLGWIDGLIASATTFFMISLVFVLGLRSVALKFLPGDTSVDNVSLDDEPIGAIVEVISEISASVPGRISYRGTGWPAKSSSSHEKGDKVIIKGKSDEYWLVTSIEEGI